MSHLPQVLGERNIWTNVYVCINLTTNTKSPQIPISSILKVVRRTEILHLPIENPKKACQSTIVNSIQVKYVIDDKKYPKETA